MTRKPSPVRGSQSTAVVLWLMILLVFVPIATAHAIARVLGGGTEHASGAP